MPVESEPSSEKLFVNYGTVCHLFNRVRLSALETTLKLEVLIAELELAERFDGAEVMKDRLTPTLKLLTELSADLLFLEFLKLALRTTR